MMLKVKLDQARRSPCFMWNVTFREGAIVPVRDVRVISLDAARTLPQGPMMPLTPVVAARSGNRLFSTARKIAIAKSRRGEDVFPFEETGLVSRDVISCFFLGRGIQLVQVLRSLLPGGIASQPYPVDRFFVRRQRFEDEDGISLLL